MAARSPAWTLNFHGIGPSLRTLDPGEDEYWLDVERFHSILDAIAGKAGFQVTFDDGNRSDIDIALPALMERGIRATFFVLAGKLDKPGYLRREDVQALAGAGMAIGSHGWSHRSWRGLSPEDRTCELLDSKRVLEELIAAPVDAAACPFGAYDRGVLTGIREAGYRVAYSSDRGADPGTGFLRPRNTVRASDDAQVLLAEREAFRSSPLRRLKLAVKRWR